MQYVTITGLRHMRMPMVGLGTWRAQPEEVKKAVLAALDVGYRHIDTAFNYNNEEAIGNALNEWISQGKGKREDVFITTKLPHIGNRPSDVEKFLRLSLDRLQLDYIDLYLIHMPFSFYYNKETLLPERNPDGTYKLDTTNDHIATWKAMEEQVRNGLTKAIGLSNFNMNQIRKIYSNSTIKPSVLQVEMHAYCQQRQLMQDCDDMSIVLTAYAPLGSPGAQYHFAEKYKYAMADYPDILGHPLINDIAIKHGKTSSQIVLKHLLTKNVVVIPKSSHPDRIKENINIFDFDLDEEDTNTIDSLDKQESGRIFNFKFFTGVEKHPEYPFKTQTMRDDI